MINMSNIETEFRGLAPTYIGFIAKSINLIFLYSIQNEPEEYYRAVRQFIRFLPNRVKKEIMQNVTELEQELSNAIIEVRQRESDLVKMQQDMANVKRLILARRTDGLVDRLMDELDKKGLMEIRKDYRTGTADKSNIDFRNEEKTDETEALPH